MYIHVHDHDAHVVLRKQPVHDANQEDHRYIYYIIYSGPIDNLLHFSPDLVALTLPS